jgi:hypothetical protein
MPRRGRLPDGVFADLDVVRRHADVRMTACPSVPGKLTFLGGNSGPSRRPPTATMSTSVVGGWHGRATDTLAPLGDPTNHG